jgi:hypothetical protein
VTNLKENVTNWRFLQIEYVCPSFPQYIQIHVERKNREFSRPCFPFLPSSIINNWKETLSMTDTNKIHLYSLATPNGVKVAAALEEMGLKYDSTTINIMKGDQFKPEFIKVNVSHCYFQGKILIFHSLIRKFQPLQTPVVLKENPSTFLNQEPFFYIWQKKLENFYQMIQS